MEDALKSHEVTRDPDFLRFQAEHREALARAAGQTPGTIGQADGYAETDRQAEGVRRESNFEFWRREREKLNQQAEAHFAAGRQFAITANRIGDLLSLLAAAEQSAR